MPETRTIAAAIVCYASCISPDSDGFSYVFVCLGELGLRREDRSDPAQQPANVQRPLNLPAIDQFPFLPTCLAINTVLCYCVYSMMSSPLASWRMFEPKPTNGSPALCNARRDRV